MNRMITIMEAHQGMTAYLERHGVEQPRLCSEILLSNALDMERVQIYARFDQTANAEGLDKARDMGRRLAKGEPIQLVVGNAQFFSFFIQVRNGVFIPRPETETLVDAAASFLRKMALSAPDGLRALDLCSGSGVIAVALAKFVPELRVKAVDISPAAVELGAENAEALGVSDRCDFARGDLFGATDSHDTFHAIVSNPPYIPTKDIMMIEPVVRDYDPMAALDGGEDGLDIVRKIAAGAMARLADGGFLIVEIGIGQAGETKMILETAGFQGVEIMKDLSGIDRVVAGWRK